MNPLASAVTFMGAILSGRLRFPHSRVGESYAVDGDRMFRIFREARRKPARGRSELPGARFVVRFRLARMSPRLNRIFSMIPIPFFVGLPGFRSKLWMMDEETGEFQGVYEWQTVEDARNYATSFAMRFMKARAEPGSVAHEVTALFPEPKDAGSGSGS